MSTFLFAVLLVVGLVVATVVVNVWESIDPTASGDEEAGR